jgi:hypothetical protein
LALTVLDRAAAFYKEFIINASHALPGPDVGAKMET